MARSLRAGFVLVIGLLLIAVPTVSKAQLKFPRPRDIVNPVIVDSHGRVVGPLVTGIGLDLHTVMKLGGVPISLRVTLQEIKGFLCCVGVYFESLDCSGTALLKATDVFGGPLTVAPFGGRSVSGAQDIYVPEPEPTQQRVANSFIDLNIEQVGCQAITSPDDYAETLTFSLSIFDVFVPPFSVAGVRNLH